MVSLAALSLLYVQQPLMVAPTDGGAISSVHKGGRSAEKSLAWEALKSVKGWLLVGRVQTSQRKLTAGGLMGNLRGLGFESGDNVVKESLESRGDTMSVALLAIDGVLLEAVPLQQTDGRRLGIAGRLPRQMTRAKKSHEALGQED